MWTPMPQKQAKMSHRENRMKKAAEISSRLMI
jgi:hypothetical protein